VNNQIRDEIATGKRAEAAYSEFIGPFIRDKREQLIDAFDAVDIDKVNTILEIKRTLKSLKLLEEEIQTAIQTGKLAKIGATNGTN